MLGSPRYPHQTAPPGGSCHLSSPNRCPAHDGVVGSPTASPGDSHRRQSGGKQNEGLWDSGGRVWRRSIISWSWTLKHHCRSSASCENLFIRQRARGEESQIMHRKASHYYNHRRCELYLTLEASGFIQMLTWYWRRSLCSGALLELGRCVQFTCLRTEVVEVCTNVVGEDPTVAPSVCYSLWSDCTASSSLDPRSERQRRWVLQDTAELLERVTPESFLTWRRELLRSAAPGLRGKLWVKAASLPIRFHDQSGDLTRRFSEISCSDHANAPGRSLAEHRRDSPPSLQPSTTAPTVDSPSPRQQIRSSEQDEDGAVLML
ncbi:hypothetical protein DNTS_029358 [Danionella cerebrum]|uniref:Uncharacterized protein n=1 Tax=Danionella cerebrum TaxID=2873325 RepID=A0A553Q7W6_9TELE|nr:hypothetical protein DNTS_029358 [Danionella translucida]